MAPTPTKMHTLDAGTMRGIQHRLNRAVGQIQAVNRMFEHPADYTCKDVVSQLKAARSALRKVSELYVVAQLEHCNTLPEPERSVNLTEALKALSVE